VGGEVASGRVSRTEGEAAAVTTLLRAWDRTGV
jgi:hypothetical protein